MNQEQFNIIAGLQFGALDSIRLLWALFITPLSVLLLVLGIARKKEKLQSLGIVLIVISVLNLVIND